MNGLPHNADRGRIIRSDQTWEFHRPCNVAIGIAGLEMRIAKSTLNALVEQPDCLECPQCRPLQGYSNARHAPLRVDFDDFRFNAAALESDGKRHAGDSATNDQHVSNCGHIGTLAQIRCWTVSRGPLKVLVSGPEVF